MKTFSHVLAGLALLLGCVRVDASTFYVRTDGGTASQCSGLVDAPYPGSGSAQACAWHHPFDALPPQSDATPPPAVPLHGGDTLIIDRGSYEMGAHAPGASAYAACNASWSWDCFMAAIPSGTAAQPTQVLGAGWDSGCTAPPELWGSEHSAQVVSLAGSSNVKVACLEITDHSACIESLLGGSSPNACNRSSPPFGDWASRGIYAKDSSNVTLKDLNIHGMANRGILAGRLSNWTVSGVRINANGWGGWDGDLGESAGSSDSGTMQFDNLEVGYNGCTEQYPSSTIYACWGQAEGGYGDGFGETTTSGNWVFTNAYFHHNTQDGLDLLYADATATIKVDQTHAEGNAGNQIKLAGSPTVQNSVIVGNCSYFTNVGYMSGNNSGGAGTAGDQCRALGNTLVISLQPKLKGLVQFNTIAGEGDCLILGKNGDASSSIAIYNNALVGKPSWIHADQSPQPQSCLFYWDSGPSSWPVAYGGNLVYQVKDNACPAGSICNADPQLANAALSAFDAAPLATSPLVNAADTTVGTLSIDLLGQPRPSSGGYDIGALQLAASGGGTGGTTGGTPNASFAASTNGLGATFADTSTDAGGTIGSHAWNFGDGATSTSANPSHTYANGGTYAVTETVTDSVNGKNSTATVSVTVTAPPVGGTPSASFKYSVRGLAASFSDTSTDTGGTLSAHLWKFGDGATSTATNPSHSYGSNGTYTVTETVTDGVSGKTSTATHSVSVLSLCGSGRRHCL